MHTDSTEQLTSAETRAGASITPQTALEQLSSLTQISNEPDFDRKLQLIVDGLNQLGWNRVALTLRDESFTATKIITAGLTEEELAYLRNNMVSPQRWLELFKEPSFQSFRDGSIYFVPGDSMVSQRLFGNLLPDEQAQQTNSSDWHPRDLMTVLLRDRQQKYIGLINLDQPASGQRPSDEMRQTIELYSQFAAATIENAMLVEETLGRANELENLLDDIVERERFYSALGSMSLAIHYTLDLNAVMNLICREGQSIFGVDGTYIWQTSAETYTCQAAEGDSAETYLGLSVPVTDEPMARLMQRREAFFINNFQRQPSRPSVLPNDEQIQAMMGVPLEQDGHQIAYLFMVETHNPKRFNDRDVTWASMFAVQAAVALRNAQLFAELRSFNTELDRRVAERTQALSEESNRVKILLRITSELSSSLDQGRVLNQALELVNESINATQGVILLINQETNQLDFRAAIGTKTLPPDGRPSGLMRHEGLAGWVISHSESVIVHDTLTDDRWIQRDTSADLRSVLAVPLVAGEEIIGVLMLFHTEPNTFTREQVALVEAAATQVANATSNANLYLLIRDQAERLGKMLRLEQVESAKNQAILESIADGVLVADENNQITLANRPASTILGITRDALIGKPINELLGLYGQSARPWLETINSWSLGNNRNGDLRYLADKLSIENKVVSIHLSPVIAGQQFFGTVSIFRDITKEVEVDRLKSEFVSNVSHELRTPMTSIKGYVDLLLLGAGGKVSTTQRNYLQVVKNNAQRLQLLVNDLLDISRLESGQTQLEQRPFSIDKLINSLVYGYAKDRIERDNVPLTLESDLQQMLPFVYGDEERITQVLTNLLDNAMNYTPEGSIVVRAEHIDNYVQVSVQDNGIGIAPENLQRIFDRFFRADAADVQKVPGTGLGLAIVHSLITMHGGEMTVESKLGEGSTFKFTLPVASPGKLKETDSQEDGESR